MLSRRPVNNDQPADLQTVEIQTISQAADLRLHHLLNQLLEPLPQEDRQALDRRYGLSSGHPDFSVEVSPELLRALRHQPLSTAL